MKWDLKDVCLPPIPGIPVVDIAAIKLNHSTQLPQQSISHRLNAQVLDDLHQVIAGRPGVVHTRVRQHLSKSTAERFVLDVFGPA